MTTNRDEVIDFLREFWKAARRPGPQASAAERKISEYLERLSAVRSKLEVSDNLPVLKKGDRPRGAFSPSRRAFWINRAALGEWLGPNQKRTDADHMLEFYDGKEFALHVNNFVGSARFDIWWSEQITVGRWSGITQGSVIVHGAADGLWFGVRTLEEITDTMRVAPDLFSRIHEPTEKSFAEILRTMPAQRRSYLVQQRVTTVISSTNVEQITDYELDGPRDRTPTETEFAGSASVEESAAPGRPRDWTNEWNALRRDPQQRDIAFVLQTLMTLSHIGFDPVESIAEAFFRECQGTQLTFRDTVATLGKNGWITREAFSLERDIRGFRDIVYDARLYLQEEELGCIVSSINEGYPAAWFVDDFLKWVAKTELLDTRMRRTLLWDADRVYEHHPHEERIRLGALVRISPTVEPPFHDVMAKLVRIGEVDASLLGIERLRGSKWEDITFYPPVLRSVIETAFERIDEIWPACVNIAKRITPLLPDLIQKPTESKEGLFVDEFISAICRTVTVTADQHGPPIIKRVCEAFQGEHHRWRFYMAVLNPYPKTGRRLLEGLDLKTIPEKHQWLYKKTWDDVSWYTESCPDCEKAWNEGTSTRHNIPILVDGPPGLERRGPRLLSGSGEES